MAKKEASFRAWLQRVRRTGQFSDVIVRVEGEQFNLHLLPLKNASLFFRSADVRRPEAGGGGRHPEIGADSGGSSGESSDSGGGRNLDIGADSSGASSDTIIIDLGHIPGGAEGFAMAADFCYLIKPTFTMRNIAKAKAVAEHLGMAELVEATKKFMYMNVFSHWSSCAEFLEGYKRLSSPSVDEYVESRCVKVISTYAAKAFLETKHLRTPISGGHCRSSPCNDVQPLTDILARICSLPDPYVSCIFDRLLRLHSINLHLSCRQARNVKPWIDAVLLSHLQSHRARCWFVLALSRMLQNSSAASTARPWLELSSQYCCCLLYHAQRLLMKTADPAMAELLRPVVCFLEKRIGRSLHELDEYLLSYDFEPRTLISLVSHFAAAVAEAEGDAAAADLSVEQMVGVAAEVDGCLWRLAEAAPVVSEAEFAGVVEAFPGWARKSHDMLYAGIEKMIATKAGGGGGGGGGERWRRHLWGLVDAGKLSPDQKERALRNAEFLSQPHVLEHVLRSLREELSESLPDGGTSQHQSLIVNQIVHASLNLLQENARRSNEISELRRRYSALVVTSSKEEAASTLSSPSRQLRHGSSDSSSPRIISGKIEMKGCAVGNPNEVDEADDGVAATGHHSTFCSTGTGTGAISN